jgi:hypothetical protein
MKEVDPCRKLTLHKPAGTSHVEKHKLRCLESVEKDRKNMGVRNCRIKNSILEGSKVTKD